VRSARYWLVVAAAVPVGLLAGALLTTHFARPPADLASRPSATTAAFAGTPSPHSEAASPQPANTDQATRARNAAFVRAAYADTLGAPPSQDELNGWLAALDSGASRVQVAAALLVTPQYAAALTNIAFQRLLGRNADSDAAAAWTAALKAGAPPEQLVAGVLGSNEYYGQHSNTDATWLGALFRELLGRDPTPAERAAQLAALSSGARREDIAYGLSLTDEYRRHFLDLVYQQYLGRAPTADEQRWLLDAMTAGQSSAAVRAALLGSDEYLRRHAAA